MSTKLTCNQCDAEFYTNFQLYQHKAKMHTPIVGIVSKDDDEDKNKGVTINVKSTKKRKYQGDGKLHHGDKYRKINVSNDEQSGEQDSVPNADVDRSRRRVKKPKRKFIPYPDESGHNEENNSNDHNVSNAIPTRKRKYEGDGQLHHGKKYRKINLSNDEQSNTQDSEPERIIERPRRRKKMVKRKFIPHRDESENSEENNFSDPHEKENTP